MFLSFRDDASRSRKLHMNTLTFIRGGGLPSSSQNQPRRQPLPSGSKHSRQGKKKNENDDDIANNEDDDSIGVVESLISSAFLGVATKFVLGTTIALYILNQKHLLPKSLSAVVSRTLFWPTVPITVSRRIGKWVTNIDDSLVMGGAPFWFYNIPKRLHRDYGVRGVINMCEEYRGPLKRYEKLGMEELWLRTVDHFEPSFEDIKAAVSFIDLKKAKNERVYVHCRAGHGRSAAVALAWLIYKNPDENPQHLNSILCNKRNVRKALWKQPNMKKFHSFLQDHNYDLSS